MIARIRYLFLTRTIREKFMVLMMLLVGAFIWLTLFADRLEAFLETRRELAREIAYQRVYLDNRERIEERVEEGIATLDTERTLSATNLVVEVGNLARRHGLRQNTGAPSTEPGEVFSYHTVRLVVEGAELADLINFTADLQERAPYLGIDEITISAADRNDPRRLRAIYYISAVELTPES